MAEPAYNQGGLIGFDETTGGNTTTGNNSSAPQGPINPPIPTPTVTPSPPKPSEPMPTNTLEDVTSVSVKPKTGVKRTLREILNEDEEVIEKIAIGDFSEKGNIRITGDYPQNFVDVPTYNLSNVERIADPEISFDFILCLKDGDEGTPQLFATKEFMDVLDKEYEDENPFGVNDIIEDKNIVVVDIKPIKEKVEALRSKELSINLNRNEIAGQVEVRKNLFVYSNYDVGNDGVLVPNPTYDLKELIKYISWVVTKPAAKYDDRLIPTEDLGDFDGYVPKDDEQSGEDLPSENISDDKQDDDGNPTDPNPTGFPPIGRRGVEPGETVLFNGRYWEWDAVNQIWTIDTTNNGENTEDDSTPGQGNPPSDNDGSSGNTGGSPGTGTGRPGYMD